MVHPSSSPCFFCGQQFDAEVKYVVTNCHTISSSLLDFVGSSAWSHGFLGAWNSMEQPKWPGASCRLCPSQRAGVCQASKAKGWAYPTKNGGISHGIRWNMKILIAMACDSGKIREVFVNLTLTANHMRLELNHWQLCMAHTLDVGARLSSCHMPRIPGFPFFLKACRATSWKEPSLLLPGSGHEQMSESIWISVQDPGSNSLWYSCDSHVHCRLWCWCWCEEGSFWSILLSCGSHPSSGWWRLM